MNIVGMTGQLPLGQGNTSIKNIAETKSNEPTFLMYVQQQMNSEPIPFNDTHEWHRLLDVSHQIDLAGSNVEEEHKAVHPELTLGYSLSIPVHDLNVEFILAEDVIPQSQTGKGKHQIELQQIVMEFNELLAGVNSEQDLQKIAPKVLELLKQWKQIQVQFGQITQQTNHGDESVQLEENQLWKEIFQTYQSRANQKAYENDAQVTTKDVMRWIKNALQKLEALENGVPLQTIALSSNTVLPDNKQYVILINQQQSGQAIETQLLEQFQHVMKTSKFLSMPNGMNQLTIALRPENLGEMMVRVIEINGEMTVKIMVTSQTTKEILESNLQQLRHMFTPQQVIIERQDVGFGQEQEQANQKQDASKGQEQHQSNDSESEHQKQNDDTFETHLDTYIQLEEMEVENSDAED